MKSSLIAAILLASFAYSAVAQTQKIASQTFIAPAPQPKDSAIIQNAYMIELHTEPGSPGVTVEQEEFRKSIRLLNIPFNERGALTVALNSISIEVDDGDMEQIKKLAQVKRVWPLRSVAPPRMHVTGTTQNATFPYYHSMTGVETLHSKYNLEGQGIKIGVIDSGIDYMHPALGGCFGKNCRVAYGWDFVGDDYNDKNKPVEDADPRDCMGHGTHVAGIIGARDKSFVGVAPSVTFGAYRVFGCDSRADDDIIVRAMELAYIQNMDVINLSLGGDGNWPQSFDTVVAEWLTRKGLIVVAAMGNSATNGIWEASSPGVAPSVFSVAALDNVKYQAYTFTINGDASHKIPYQSSKADQRLNFNTTEVVAVGTGAASIGCDSIKLNLTGKIALIKRGSCSFPQKALNAQKAGASAVIIYNNVFGILAPGGEDPEIKIPFVGIEQSTGEDFAKRLSKGPLKLDFGTNIVEFSNPTGGHIADFSSWGPGPRSEIKPDIGAPGGLIYSTYPLAKGSYATESGTSMATPYVVGSVALYLQVKGLNITQHPFDESTSQKIKFNTTAQTIDQQRMREAFQNSARPTTEVRADQLTSSVALQGAGLIDVERAIFNTLHVKPSRLALNDTQYLGNRKGNAQVRTIQITNTGSEKRTYTVTHRPAVSVRGLDDNGVPPVKPELRDVPADVSFSASSIVVQPKQTVDVDVHITQPASLPKSQLWIFSGYVVVSPNTNSSKSLSNEAVHVPYLGIKGRLSNIHVLQATKDLPSFTNVATSKKITQQDQTDTYTLTKTSFPLLSYKIDFASRYVTAFVFDANTNTSLGRLPGVTSEWVGRNDVGDKKAYRTLWLGKVIPDDKSGISKRLPNGKYYIKLMALRPYGQIENTKDYDIWRSPTITFQRP